MLPVRPAALALALLFSALLAAAAQEARGFVSVAIMDFSTSSDTGETFLGESFANSLATKLTGVAGIKVYERSQFAKLAGELGLSQSEAVDRGTVQAVGKIVAIDFMAVGSVTRVKDALRVNLRLTEVKSGKAVLAEEIGGAYDDFFDLQDTFALRVIEALKVRLTDKEKAAVFQKPTKSPAAYALYNSSLSAPDAMERIRALKTALVQDPHFLQALHLLADSYVEIDDADEAVRTYERILSEAPEDFKALYNAALLSFDRGDLARARQGLSACAAIKPSDPDVWYHLGLVAEYNADGERQGPGADLVRSHEQYRKAVDLDPNHLEATFALGLLEARFAQESADLSRQKDLLASSVDRLESYLRIHPAAVNAVEVRENVALLKEALRQIVQALGGK